MKKESGKEYLKEDDDEIPSAVFCPNCGDEEDLTYEESYFWKLGLRPWQCGCCGELCYNGSHPALNEYLEGPK